MGLSLNETWPDVVDAGEHLNFFLKMDEALEGFLGEFAVRSAPSYLIIAHKGEVNRASRSEVSIALDSLGGSPRGFTASYIEPRDPWWTGRAVQFKTEESSSQRISCSLSVQGQNETEVRGQFEMVRNLLAAEIRRQLSDARMDANATSNAMETSWWARTWRDNLAAFLIGIGIIVASGVILYRLHVHQ